MNTISYPRPRKSLPGCLLAGLLLISGIAFADAGSMSCNLDVPSKHAELAEGDQNSKNHLELSRPVAAGATLELNLCGGDVRLVASKNGSLNITVDLGLPSGQHLAGDYLERLEVTPKEARVDLHLARSLQAKVTIEIPVSVPQLDINLARGQLLLAANQVGGERQINVGYGQVKVQGNDDAYESMEINVGLGSLHDHRRGGENHHLIVAHSFAGNGKGRIEINVGMGHVDIDPSNAQPI